MPSASGKRGSGPDQVEDRTRLVARRGAADGIRYKKPGYAKEARQGGKPPQAVVKVISQARGHRVGILLDYVARAEEEKPLTMEDENGLTIEGPEQRKALLDDWKKDFERAKPGQKRPPRHVTHVIFSGDCEQNPKNARAVQASVAELMREQLGKDGFRYVMVLHQDTDHPHVHVLINNYNVDKARPKLRLNPPELLALRQQFAQKMRDRGLEQNATRRIDRLQILERIALGQENLRAAGTWYEAKMLRAASKEGPDLSQIEATENMLALAVKIAVDKGVELTATDFQSVREFLDKNSEKSGAVLGFQSDTGTGGTDDKPRAFDAFAKRKSMARLVAKMKDDVKATTLPLSQKRREQMAELRRLDKELIQAKPIDYSRVVESLALKLGKDVSTVREQLRELMTKPREGMDKGRIAQRRKALEKIIARKIEAIKETRRDLIREPGLSVFEGYALGHQLKQYERDLAKLKRATERMGKGSGLILATPSEVEAARASIQALAKIDRATQKLEAMGAWYDPPEGRRPEHFDAFAKRQSMVKIVTHLRDELDGLPAGKRPDSETRERLDSVARMLKAPAPDYSPMVAQLEARTKADAQRIDYEARRAAHPRTLPAERATIAAQLEKDLVHRLKALDRAAKEIKASNMPPDRRELLAERINRIARATERAGKALSEPVALKKHVAAMMGLSSIANRSSASRNAFKGNGADSGRNATSSEHRRPPEPLDKAPTLSSREAVQRTHSPGHEQHGHNPQTVTRSQHYGSKLANLNFDGSRTGDFLRDNSQFETGRPPESLAGVRELSGIGVVQNASPAEKLLPDHAPNHLGAERKGTAPDGLRRPGDGLGTVQRGTSQESGVAPIPRINPTDVTQQQLASLLKASRERMAEAGGWDSPTPFRSAYHEAVDGWVRSPNGRVMDAFEKRRAMLQEPEKLSALIDRANRIPFTQEMRRDLAAIREMRDITAEAQPGDITEVISRLAQKVTDDQIKMESLRDNPPKSATETLKRARDTVRIAENAERSIKIAREAVNKSTAPRATKDRLNQTLAQLGRAMGRYSGNGMGR